MISLFTPTHAPDRLQRLYNSLKVQTNSLFEWVVCPNGSRTDEIIQLLKSFGDDRIKIHPVPAEVSSRVGALKRFACERCEGELFVEVDHDDWLAPTCVSKLVIGMRLTDAGFLFSESIGMDEGKDTVETYSQQYGWEYGSHEYNGKTWPVMLAFDIDPRSLSEIYWCPNHARAWTREAYWKAGGHDAGLSLADDQDLMCRTYLAGVTFGHIKEVLYYQGRHEQATSIRRWEEVRDLSMVLKNRYLHRMIFEWCRRQGLAMIDLGGAHDCPRQLGFKSMDLNNRAGNVDYVCDATVMPDIRSDSVGCFRASDFLEHLPTNKIIPFMNTIYDRLADKGWLISWTPSVTDVAGRTGRGAFQDPTHVSYWSENNFWYFTDANYAKYCPEITCRFQLASCSTGYPTQWHKDHMIPYVQADLLALKGARVPGGSRI